jgi:hypothetical protein
MLPLTLSISGGRPVTAQGLLDSGAMVNVLPYHLGVALGAVWDAQTIRVSLTGNLAAHEARALLVEARAADWEPVNLAFAWSQSDAVPLLLGQVNFFESFDVCFHRARRHVEVDLAQR